MPLPRRCLLPVAALTLLLPACGSDGGAKEATDDRPPTAVLEDAITATKAADTAHTRLDLYFAGGPKLGTQDFVLEADFALDGSQADIEAASGENTMVSSRTLKVRVKGERAWVGGAQLADALPDGASWASLPTDRLVASEGYSDPGDLAFLYLMKGASAVRKDPKSTAARTTYRFRVDLARAARRSPASLRDQVRSTMSFQGTNDRVVTGLVTLDHKGRVLLYDVRGIQRATARERAALGAGSIQVRLLARFDDFDHDLDVQAPAGDDVVPISQAPKALEIVGLDEGADTSSGGAS